MGSDHSEVPDQRPVSQDMIVNRSLPTRLGDEPDASSARVLDILKDELHPTPPEALPCLNPKCGDVCLYPPRGTRGHRPSRFCSRSCRDTFDRDRKRLVVELQVLDDLAKTMHWSKRQRVDLQRQISLRRWALTRYAVEDN